MMQVRRLGAKRKAKQHAEQHNRNCIAIPESAQNFPFFLLITQEKKIEVSHEKFNGRKPILDTPLARHARRICMQHQTISPRLVYSHSHCIYVAHSPDCLSSNHAAGAPALRDHVASGSIHGQAWTKKIASCQKRPSAPHLSSLRLGKLPFISDHTKEFQMPHAFAAAYTLDLGSTKWKMCFQFAHNP
jgi:hypothetical protein